MGTNVHTRSHLRVPLCITVLILPTPNFAFTCSFEILPTALPSIRDTTHPPCHFHIHSFPLLSHFHFQNILPKRGRIVSRRINVFLLFALRYHAVLNLCADSTKPSQPSEVVTASTSTSDAASATAEKKRRADIAAQRRARIMAKMASMQQNFIKTNETFFQVIEMMYFHFS